MFLKSIELFGFKSFADRTRIDFTDGISALLGPNGCGKSNIVDAIKWVLGEQSTKTLRAERMEDVIFNGTEGRKALNVAEVQLALSNDEGILPLDVPEISIKRRLYRSGESEYFINNTPVRLKEVREVFFDTGVGKSSYSIMEQGKIDRILSSKPEERRYIFEEAAGITKYKMKGAEAERKLALMEENMRQVESILSEVKRSHNTLKAQSEKTSLYRRYREESFELELNIQLLKLKSFLEDQREKEEKLVKRKEERDALKSLIDGINESLEENLDIVNSMESKLIETQKTLYGIDLEKNNKASQIIILGERGTELERQISNAQAKEKALSEKIESLTTQIKEKKKALLEFTERLGEVEQNITSFEENIERAASRIDENEKQIRENETEIKDLDKKAVDLQNDLRNLTDVIVNQLDQGLKETGYSYQERKNAEEKIKGALKKLLIHIEGKISLLEDILASEIRDTSETRKALENSLLAMRDGRGTAEDLSSLFESYRKTTPAFLDEFLAPEGIITRKREIDSRVEESRSGITERRDRISTLQEENRGLTKRIDGYRKTLEDLRVNRVRMKTQRSGVEEALGLLQRDIEGQQSHLEENRLDIITFSTRIKEIGKQVKLLETDRSGLEQKEKILQKVLAGLEDGISRKNKDLIQKEKKLKSRIDNLGKVQNQVEKVQIDLASINTEIRNIYDNFKDRHSRDLSDFDSRIYEINTPVKGMKEKLSKLKENLKSLGQVNLMAPEEYIEVKERYEFLSGQIEDLIRGREDLKQITTQIKTESTELFLETYEKIKRNFHAMFRRLFGGGRGELKLVDPDNILTSGIEIYAQPPGKNLENIALLSGGERSLTAVAMLFATYMVKPSPFCILDEIDAALDEANVARFVNLLVEFGENSQFVVITHNKKTVAGAKTLLGVTMEESGVSKVIMVRLEKEEVGVS